MSAVLLALASALAYGTGDFLAGWLARHLHYGLVGLLSQAGAALTITAAVPFAVGSGPNAAALGWGALSGLGGGAGSLLLYRGMGRGQMSVVSPLAALGSAVLPAVVGLASGEHPSVLTVTGIVLALPALWLTAKPTGRSGGGAAGGGLGDGLLSGAGFALLFIALAQAGDQSGLWPLVASAWVSLLLQGIWSVSHRSAITVPRPTLGLTAATSCTGVVSVTASLLYFLATHAGLLSVVAVTTSLYPAITVLLAVLLLHERPGRGQRVGLLAAALAIALISNG